MAREALTQWMVPLTLLVRVRLAGPRREISRAAQLGDLAGGVFDDFVAV
jgi:hypothetical protein